MGKNKLKIFISVVLLAGLFFNLRAEDSRKNPIIATYCDGSEIKIYPYSFVTRYDGTTFNDYEVKVSPIEDSGLRYAFEDAIDNDYNDLIVDLWVSGNGTGSPVVHVRFVSKDAYFNHKLHLVYGTTDVFVFDANEATPGTVFDVLLPAVECSDFSINVAPPHRSIYPGESTFYTVVVQSKGGFSHPVELSVEGLPQGANGEFDQNPVTPTGETKLNIKTEISVQPGTYTLTVKGEAPGISHSSKVILEIKECPDFEISIEAEPKEGPVPLEVNFRAKINGGEGEYSYHWNFGDGKISKEKNPKHTYISPGRYTVTLEVQNQCGKKKTSEITINAHGFEGVIAKRFLETDVLPTEEVFMELKINNTSSYDFENVEIWDELSPYLEYIGDDAPVKVEISGYKLTWVFSKLKKGESISFTVRLKVREDTPPMKIVNVAYLNHRSLKNPIESNKAYLEIKSPKIELEKIVDKNIARPGEVLLYTLKAKNSSRIDIKGLRIKDEIPEELEFISQDSSFLFKMEGNKLTWEGILKERDTNVILIKVKIKNTTLSGTVINNKAFAMADILQEEVESNMVQTTVISEPISTSKIVLRKEAEIPQVEVGKIIRFRVTIHNMSSSPLMNVRIDDYLPQGFNYVKSTTIYNGIKFDDPQGNKHLHWNLPIIQPGENAILRYQVIIGSDAKRGKNINRAMLSAMDNSGQNITLEADAFVNVSSSGFIFYCGIEGFVYIDRNKNGTFDPSDPSLKDIEIRLSTGEKVYTDLSGHFLIEGLYPGEYAIGINTANLPENLKLISPSPISVVLQDGLTTYVEFRVSLKKEEEVGKASIDGFVFLDKNSNGIFDEGEPRPENFKAVLDNKLLAEGEKGIFKFSHVEPGNHIIEIRYGDRAKSVKVELKEGPNSIKIPIKFSGIKVTIRGEK